MREIKFRAWDKIANEMIDIIGFVIRETEIRYWYYSKHGHVFNRSAGRNNIIVIQYTGLKDINGKDIFEGDIVEGYVYDVFGRFEVVFDEGAFSLVVDSDYTPCIYEANPEQLKIIGNIYENEELLK